MQLPSILQGKSLTRLLPPIDVTVEPADAEGGPAFEGHAIRGDGFAAPLMRTATPAGLAARQLARSSRSKPSPRIRSNRLQRPSALSITLRASR